MVEDKKENVMRTVKVEKVTLNIGAGANPDDVKKAIKLIETISGKKAVQTYGSKRIPTWDVRPGLPLGAKVTVRGTEAVELLKRLLKAVENKLKESQFTQNGFSFGIKEYIEIPEVRYDPELGIIGLDVCVTLTRPGARIAKRKVLRKSLKKQSVSKEDAINYAKENLEVNVE